MFELFLIGFLIAYPASWPFVLFAATLNMILGPSTLDENPIALVTVGLSFVLWPNPVSFLFFIYLLL